MPKGGFTGSSESTLVKMPHCWKSRVAAQLCYPAILRKGALGDKKVTKNNLKIICTFSDHELKTCGVSKESA